MSMQRRSLYLGVKSCIKKSFTNSENEIWSTPVSAPIDISTDRQTMMQINHWMKSPRLNACEEVRQQEGAPLLRRQDLQGRL